MNKYDQVLICVWLTVGQCRRLFDNITCTSYQHVIYFQPAVWENLKVHHDLRHATRWQTGEWTSERETSIRPRQWRPLWHGQSSHEDSTLSDHRQRLTAASPDDQQLCWTVSWRSSGICNNHITTIRSTMHACTYTQSPSLLYDHRVS